MKWLITQYNLCSHVLHDCLACQHFINMPAECFKLDFIWCSLPGCQHKEIFSLLLFRNIHSCTVVSVTWNQRPATFFQHIRKMFVTSVSSHFTDDDAAENLSHSFGSAVKAFASPSAYLVLTHCNPPESNVSQEHRHWLSNFGCPFNIIIMRFYLLCLVVCLHFCIPHCCASFFFFLL